MADTTPNKQSPLVHPQDTARPDLRRERLHNAVWFGKMFEHVAADNRIIGRLRHGCQRLRLVEVELEEPIHTRVVLRIAIPPAAVARSGPVTCNG